jgi:hypothetical protein
MTYSLLRKIENRGSFRSFLLKTLHLSDSNVFIIRKILCEQADTVNRYMPDSSADKTTNDTASKLPFFCLPYIYYIER